jgi:hypothetical protein
MGEVTGEEWIDLPAPFAMFERGQIRAEVRMTMVTGLRSRAKRCAGENEGRAKEY